MSIIGFLFLIGLGVFFILGGIFNALMSAGFTGKAGFLWTIPVSLGTALIWLCIHFSPIQITAR